MIELEKKIQEEYVKVPERLAENESEKERTTEIRKDKSIKKMKSLSFKRSSRSKPALDLDSMWRQEEEKAMGPNASKPN